MTSLFKHPTRSQHENHISILDRGQPMGDRYHGSTAIASRLLNGLLHQLLALGVERTRRLVQKQKSGYPYQCASEGYALPLPAGEL